jgi:hypothetical protein
VARQHHIRRAGKLLAVQPEAVAQTMQQGTDGDFGSGVASLDLGPEAGRAVIGRRCGAG